MPYYTPNIVYNACEWMLNNVAAVSNWELVIFNADLSNLTT